MKICDLKCSINSAASWESVRQNMLYSNGHKVPGETHCSSQHQGQTDYLLKAAIESKPNITAHCAHSCITAKDNKALLLYRLYYYNRILST